MRTKIIGDPHGKLTPYFALVNQAEKYGENTLTVGDNGFETEWRIGESFLRQLDGGFDRHKWLGGNHDIYPNYPKFSQALPDFGEWNGLFFIRGANSIDRASRIEGVDWFRDEQLSYAQMLECLDCYEQTKPNWVITHDCPQSVRKSCFGFDEKDVTSSFLEELFQIHQPKIWIFGHYHISTLYCQNNTSFICLNELQTLNLHH